MDSANKIASTARERALYRAWHFLSSDSTVNFYRDLWVPVDHPSEFRRILNETLNMNEPYKAFVGEVNARVVSRLSSYLSTTELGSLGLWTRSVYVEEGTERVAEKVWNILISQMANRPDEFHLGAIYETLRDLQTDKCQREERLEQRFKSLTSVDASDSDELDWNRVILEKLELICSLNNFVASWSAHCGSLTPDQLFELFKAGSGLAVSQPIHSRGLPFPGSWQFELAPLLGKEASR